MRRAYLRAFRVQRTKLEISGGYDEPIWRRSSLGWSMASRGADASELAAAEPQQRLSGWRARYLPRPAPPPRAAPRRLPKFRVVARVDARSLSQSPLLVSLADGHSRKCIRNASSTRGPILSPPPRASIFFGFFFSHSTIQLASY